VPLLDAYPRVRERSEFIACSVWVAMDDKPSQALRRGRRVSSMWKAIEAVKQRRASVAISAGNTGALIAMSKVILDTMVGISRPAIAARWPTLKGESIVLDVGATIGADAEQLFDFAIMGEAMARCLFHLERPTVGLLNVGVEEIKGIEEVKEAARLLRESGLPMEYIGFVEGDDISKGTADVVVTEGFTGNIALKTAEGTAKQIGVYLKSEMKPLAHVAHGLSAGAARLPGPARQARSAQPQRRRAAGAQRHRGQEPWRHRSVGLRRGHQGCSRHGREPSLGQDRRRSHREAGADGPARRCGAGSRD
jgi:phosphate acyltransferase